MNTSDKNLTVGIEFACDDTGGKAAAKTLQDVGEAAAKSGETADAASCKFEHFAIGLTDLFRTIREAANDLPSAGDALRASAETEHPEKSESHRDTFAGSSAHASSPPESDRQSEPKPETVSQTVKTAKSADEEAFDVVKRAVEAMVKAQSGGNPNGCVFNYEAPPAVSWSKHPPLFPDSHADACPGFEQFPTSELGSGKKNQTPGSEKSAGHEGDVNFGGAEALSSSASNQQRVLQQLQRLVEQDARFYSEVVALLTNATAEKQAFANSLSGILRNQQALTQSLGDLNQEIGYCNSRIQHAALMVGN